MLVFWFICFVVLFAATEFYRWLIHLIGIDMIGFDIAELPLPVYILAGVALAIASNYSRQAGFPFPSSSFSRPLPPPTPEPSAQPTATNLGSENSPTRSIAATSAPTVQVQSAQPQPQSSTISYTIDKENHRSERRPKNP